MAAMLDDSMLRRSRALQEMMDLARFIVSDGDVTKMEAEILQRWIEKHPDMLGIYPVSELIGILRNALADGELSDEEKVKLKEILGDVAGEE